MYCEQITCKKMRNTESVYWQSYKRIKILVKATTAYVSEFAKKLCKAELLKMETVSYFAGGLLSLSAPHRSFPHPTTPQKKHRVCS